MISSFSQPYKWKKERISSHFKEPTPIISKVLVWKVEYQIKVVSPALDLIFILFCIYLCQGKPFSIIVIQVYAPASTAEEAEVEQFYEDQQDLLELKPKGKKYFIFIIGGWNANVGS